MSKTAKILITIGVILIFVVLHTVLAETRKSTGHSTPGFLGVILLVGAYYGVKAIWSKSDDKKDNEDKNDDSSILQK